MAEGETPSDAPLDVGQAWANVRNLFALASLNLGIAQGELAEAEEQLHEAVKELHEAGDIVRETLRRMEMDNG